MPMLKGLKAANFSVSPMLIFRAWATCGRVCQFQATVNGTKTEKTPLKTYGRLPLFIFRSLYQHLGSKGVEFCVL